MKKVIIAAILSFFAIHQAQAQISLNYKVGYATYDNLKDMKDLLAMIENGVEAPSFGMKIVDNFPAYITHTLDIGYVINNHEFGIKSSFLTTGGKLAVSDYSGKFISKITLNGFREGIFYRNYFYKTKMGDKQSLSFFGEISPAITINQFKMEDKQTIGEQTESASETITKVDFSIQPEFGVCYNITPHISLNASLGYDFATNVKIDQLVDSYNTYSLSGFRSNIGIGYKF